MRKFRFLQYDVFTNTPFGGNQLAVFPDASSLSDAEMQAIAREMNFSETTFVLPADDLKALRRVRIFTPSSELPFAGHPVVGTTFALASEGIIPPVEPSPVHLQLGVGTLPVDLLFEGERLSFVWMHQPVPNFTPWRGDVARLAAALGLAAGDLDSRLPIERGSAGLAYLYIPVRTQAALRAAMPTDALTSLLADPSGHLHAYLFTRDALATGVDARARMFARDLGIMEDAATGSAAGPLGVYLLRHGVAAPDELGETRMRFEQGIEMGRTSALYVAVSGAAGAVHDVRVGGEAVLVARGELLLPDHA
ncbi:MAG: PhzF family phenazine biosynthesis protein [Ktedonobacterales bacterium]